MPIPEHLTTAHLRAGVLPDLVAATPDEHRARLAATLDDTLQRLDLRTDLLTGWRDRFPLLPAPPRTQTLQQTIQAARARLRDDRATADRDELTNRRFVVAHLRDALR